MSSEFPDFAIPFGSVGKVVKDLLEEAVEAESDGNPNLAKTLFDRAMFIDSARAR